MIPDVVEPWPDAVASSAFAVAPWPMALAFIADAVAPSPIAELLGPVAEENAPSAVDCVAVAPEPKALADAAVADE